MTTSSTRTDPGRTATRRTTGPAVVILLLGFILASCAVPILPAHAQVGGGEGGGEGGGGTSCPDATRTVAVTKINDHTVEITYELAKSYPDCSPGFEPYYILMRLCELPNEYEEIDRKPLVDTACGTHDMTLDLRHTSGKYSLTYVLEEPLGMGVRRHHDRLL